MISWDATQQTIASSSNVDVLWCFDVDTGTNTYYWSTAAHTWNGHAYEAVIPEKTFSGVTEKRRNAEDGRINGTELSFGVFSTSLNPADFDGATVTVRLVMSDGTDTREMRSWVFVVRSVGRSYGILTFQCVDLLSHYLQGTFPTTPLVRNIWPDKNAIPDNMCVALPFGTVYIPLRPVWCTPATQTEGRYYLLGPGAYTYTISKLRSPRETNHNIEWTSGFNQYTADGYKVLKAVIADANGDGTADSQGLWWTNRLLDVPVKFSRSDTASTTNPALVLKAILEQMGIPSSLIDYASAETTFTTWGLSWAGALFVVENRASLLARLLVQCGATIDYDGATIRVISPSSVATITQSNVLSSSYSDDPQYTATDHDSGYVLFQEADEPWDSYQQILTTGTGTTDTPSGVQYLMDFVHDQTKALKLGRMSLQRVMGILGYSRVGLTHRFAHLQPYDVVTLSDSLGIYRPGVYEIDEVTITRAGAVQIHMRRYGHTLLGWNEITPSTATISSPNDAVSWTPALTGPDAPSGSASPNAVMGRFTVGSGSNRIIVDPNHPDVSGPTIQLVESSAERFALGKLGTDSYGVRIKDASGTTVMLVDSASASLAGWSLTGGKIYKGNIEIDSANNRIRVYSGSNYVELNNSGMYGYNALLGYTVQIPINGSAPTFSSGVIKECTYEIYTSGVIKTATDPTLTGGFLINNTRAAGYSSTGVKLFETIYSGPDQGDFYAGDYDSGNAGLKYDHSAGTLNIRGTITADALSDVPWETITGAAKPSDYADVTGTVIDGGLVTTGTIQLTDGTSTKAGITAAGVGDGNVRIWAGDTYANRATAAFRVYQSGALVATNATISGTIIAGSSSSIPWSTVSGEGRPPDYATGGSNVIADPTFGMSAGTWDLYWHRRGTPAPEMGTAYGEYGYGVRITAPGATAFNDIASPAPVNMFPVVAGDSFNIFARVRNNSLVGGEVRLKIETYDGSGANVQNLSSDITSQIGTGEWVSVQSGILTVTNTAARYMVVMVQLYHCTSGSLDVDNVIAIPHEQGATNDAAWRHPSDTTTIDGGKIYTGSITANQIAASTITGSKIAASTITGTNIAASTITGSNIAAATLTASKINGSAFGNLTISSGTITISASQGLKITTGSGLYVNALDGIEVTDSGRIKFGNGHTIFSAASTLNISSVTDLKLTAGFGYILCNASLRPTVTGGSGLVGTSTYYFLGSYTGTVYFKNAYTFDTEDDVAMIENIPVIVDAQGEPVLTEDGLVQYDAARTDWRLTNAKDLCLELTRECGRLVTLQDLATIRDTGATLQTLEGEVLTWADIEPRFFLNAKALDGLKNGAIKQLHQRFKTFRDAVQTKLDLAEQEILSLRKRVAALEGASA